MNLANGVIGASIGGVIGAGVWAGIAYGTGLEIGWIAWGVGGLVGWGHAMGHKEGGTIAGISAVVIALVSLMTGKYAAVELVLSSELGDWSDIQGEVLEKFRNDDEAVVSYIADRIVSESIENGQDLDWIEEVDFDEQSLAEAYPPEIWADASSTWHGMSGSDQDQFRQLAAQSLQEDMAALRDSFATVGFFMSFGLLDIVFFGLAAVTAYKIAAEGMVQTPDAILAESTPLVTEQSV